MAIRTEAILSVLDRCCDTFDFPMLDNGFVYLAATRMSLYRSAADWALVVEVFGFSPRTGTPDLAIYTFASSLCNRDIPQAYGKGELYKRFLAAHPNDNVRFVFPIEGEDWMDEADVNLVAQGATELTLRGAHWQIPSWRQYAGRGIALKAAPRVKVYELCRYLADVERDAVLATEAERRTSVLPSMQQILRLEQWHHPDVANDDARPSGSETFRQLAEVLATGNAGLYHPTCEPNTHWSNWLESGTL